MEPPPNDANQDPIILAILRYTIPIILVLVAFGWTLSL